MSKQTKKIKTSIPGVELEESDEAFDTEDRGMEEAIKDFADGERYIKLYRHPNELTGGRPRLLGPLSREDFNDVHIQEKYGGGSYFGRWRKRNGQYTRFNFEIDGEPKILPRRVEETIRDAEERARNPYSFLQRGQQEDEPEGSSGQSETGIGTADILRIMAETRREAREEMRTILEIAMRQNVQQPDATEKVFSLVEKIVPLITQGGGDASGGNPWLFALSQLKEPLMKMVDTIHSAVTQPKQAPAPGPIPANLKVPFTPTGKETRQEPPTAEPREPEPKSEDDMLIESFKPYLPMLVKAATDAKDPALYSDLILDQIPNFAYDRLLVWLLKPGCLNDLAKLDGAILNQRGWWEALRSLLLEALNEELGHGVRSVQPVTDSNAAEAGPTTGPLVS